MGFLLARQKLKRVGIRLALPSVESVPAGSINFHRWLRCIQQNLGSMCRNTVQCINRTLNTEAVSVCVYTSACFWFETTEQISMKFGTENL